MMIIGRQQIRSHMTLEYEFSGIRIQHDELTPVTWKLTVNLVAPYKKKVTKEEIEYTAGLTYQKIYFWLDSNLPNIIFVNAKNEQGMFIANTSANIMMYCPDDPYDELIIQLLHSKISAISDKVFVVGEIHIKGSDVTAGYNFDCPDGEYGLPENVSDYVDGLTLHKIPWWRRNDGFCFEFIKSEEYADVPDSEYFNEVVDPMTEFEQAVKNTDVVIDIESEKEPAKIIQVEKWKPRKV